MIHDPKEIDAVFLALEKDPSDAVMVQPSLPTRRVGEWALRYQIPAVSIFRAFIEDGGVMSYCVSEAELYGRAAVSVDKILKGAKPTGLPVEQPSKFELVINIKTAKTLGLTISPALLARGDEVIE
jgi:putative ABC transport system substrate-binding protein